MHVYYINLRSRPDRRAFMEHQAVRLGIVMHRVEAVTPVDIPEEDLAAAAGLMSAGELACSYSHRSVWKMIVEQHQAAALILEDDCALADQVATLMDDPDLLSNIDLLQLETHPSTGLLGRPVATAVPGISKRRMLSSCLGTCGYMITAEMAKHCIDHPALPTMDLGKFLFSRDRPGFLYRYRIFQVFPALATPMGELDHSSELKRSDITPTRRGGRKRLPARSRSQKLKENMRHLGLSLGAFGLGELLAARYGAIPFAGASQPSGSEVGASLLQ